MLKYKKINSRSYLEIYTSIIESNVRQIKKYIGKDTKLMSILKADAYGMGIEECSKVIGNLTDWIGVATFEEAIQIRNQGVDVPILILGYVEDKDIKTAIKLNVTLTTVSLEYIKHLNSIIPEREKLNVHIKIDTGLNRIGLYSRNHNIKGFINQIKEIFTLNRIRVTGIYTHFASAGSFYSEDINFTQHQFETFIDICNYIEDLGYNLGIKHCCNSDAMVYYPNMYLGMVRVGKFLFGYGQNREINKLGIHLAFKLKARIVNLKTIEKGESVGYSRTFIAKHKMKIATVSFGFADGYRRNQSEKTEVIVNGKRAKIVGRIAMDYFMVDVTEIQNVKEGDYVTLIGRDGNEVIMPNEIAQIINGSTPELNTQIGGRVCRKYVRRNSI